MASARPGGESELDFVYQTTPSRVVFRSGGLASVAAEAAAIGRRALVLSTAEQRALADRVADLLGPIAVGVFDGAVMHVPIETARAARDEADRVRADLCVAVGGGSTIGLGKAIALKFGLPILAVPTTYAGSEMTPIWGITEAGAKRTGRDPKVLPRTVIYDPELTLTLPVGLSATSGMNAIAHCVEALYAEDTNPILQLIAEEGVRALAEALPRIARRPDDRAGRAQALYGAWLGGVCLGGAGTALHHKLCHVVAGGFNLPHAETHTIILPHAVAYNHGAAPTAMARVARALGAETAAEGLHDLARRLDAPAALRDLGMPQSGIALAVERTLENPYWNPAPIDAARLRRLLDRAWLGEPPRED